MHIQEALLKAKQESFGSDLRTESPTGEAIRRKSWSVEAHRIYHGRDNMMCNDGSHTPHAFPVAELLADDWEVVPRFTSPEYRKRNPLDRRVCVEPGCDTMFTDLSRQKAYCEEHTSPKSA